MTMAKAAQVRGEASWTSSQVYVLAAFCLVLGVAVGYLFRGSASPAADAVSMPVSGAGGVPQGVGSGTQPQVNAKQQKEMLERAVAPLLATLETSPNDFDAILRVANVYYDGQQYTDAIPYYERALKIRPENSDVRTDLGTSFWYTGEADKAIAEFEKALKYQPNHPGTLFNLGVVRWQGKMDPKGAVQAWEELLRRNPNYPQKQQIQEFIEKAKQHAKG